jgi:hypothetical protein
MVALNSKTLDLAVFRQRGGRKYAQVQIPVVWVEAAREGTARTTIYC